MPTDQYGDLLPAGATSRLGTVRFGQEEKITALAFAPDNKALASGGQDCTLRLWNLVTGKEQQRVGDHPEPITAIGFSSDGRYLASGSRDGLIAIWDLVKQRALQRFQGHQGAVYSFSFSADGEALVSAGGDDMTRLWEVATGQESHCFGSEMGHVHALAFSPDGQTLAIGTWESTVRLSELETGKVLRTLVGHRSHVQTLAFSPDNQSLATGSADETLRIWEISSGKERLRFSGMKGGVFALAFATDGKSIASAAADTTILIWDVTGRSLEKRAPTTLLPSQIEAIWKEFTSEDAGIAYRAIWKVGAYAKQLVPVFGARIRQIVPVDRVKVTNLIAELNHDQYARREKATQELEKYGALCEPHLQVALKSSPATETKRRLEKLLEKVQVNVPSADTLLALRAVESLALASTPESRKFLEALAKDTPPTCVAQAARNALDRMPSPAQEVKPPRSAEEAGKKTDAAGKETKAIRIAWTMDNLANAALRAQFLEALPKEVKLAMIKEALATLAPEEKASLLKENDGG